MVASLLLLTLLMPQHDDMRELLKRTTVVDWVG
jgi:hypothetical protein